MTTPSDPPKPTRWRRHQLEMRLRQGAPPGPERRGAKEGERAPGPPGPASAPASRSPRRGPKGA